MTPSLAAQQSLRDLIANVEGLTARADRETASAIIMLGPKEWYTALYVDLRRAITEWSLDAAVAFTEALLGEDVEIDTHAYRSMKSAHVASYKSAGAVGGASHASSLPLAVVLATLRAHAAKETI